MRNRTKAALLTSLLTLLAAAGASQTVASDTSPSQTAATGKNISEREPILQDWFADIPWHQKLSTNDSNVIDVPFMLPYEAIPAEDAFGKPLEGCTDATTETGKSRCMLEHGIVNVLGFRRTDTLYKPSDNIPDAQKIDCADGRCVRVKIDIQRLNTQTNESCAEYSDPDAPTKIRCQPDIVTNDEIGGPPSRPTSASYGFAISEATVFAPWRPWYMGHYCGYGVTQWSDSVCYESYFTTQLQAYTSSTQTWPNDRPAYFYPRDNTGNRGEKPVGNFCLKGEDKCTMYLAKVDWGEGPRSKVTGCEMAKEICRSESLPALQEQVDKATDRLDGNFEAALRDFEDVGRFPWGIEGIPTLSPKAETVENAPYLGFYDLVWSEKRPVNWPETNAHERFQAAKYVFPKECDEEDFARARRGEQDSIDLLEDCALNYELHYSGFIEQWEHMFKPEASKDEIFDIMRVTITGLAANQYGRTMFLMAGLPEQKIAVPFSASGVPGADTTELGIYDQVYGSSLYTQYLPMVNPADDNKKVMQSYGNNMWHSFFMSNHMNQTPEHFIRGVRGRTLWHNEFRSNLMFEAYYHAKSTQTTDERYSTSLRNGVKFDQALAHRDFPAGFQPEDHESPYHGNTCDSCHIRNGSGIPLAPNGSLSNIHTDRGLNSRFVVKGDYTYSNGYNPRLEDKTGKGNDPIIPSMKMVLFDLEEPTPTRTSFCDADDHTTSASKMLPLGGFYNNKIMNFYGNTFHVNLEGEFPNRLPTYTLRYVEIGSDDDFEIVDKTKRTRKLQDRGDRTYTPMRADVSGFQIGNRCKDEDFKTYDSRSMDWPTKCIDVDGAAIETAIKERKVGYMHLLGKRLGNTPLIEMIPDQRIIQAKKDQEGLDISKGGLVGHSGCYKLSAGTRSGWTLDETNYRSCENRRLGTSDEGSAKDCYIGRWGWIGDRASLEDQVANAAFVEQNITTEASYNRIHPLAASTSMLVRYDKAMCGPAYPGTDCGVENSDLTEQEIRDMASYQRWIGIPQRSEFQVKTTAVQKGEKVFREVGCSNCHIIDKVAFVEKDNMLPDEEREKLSDLQIQYDGKTDYPFVSYLGTDLLLHDMGYLSQVAKGPTGKTMREENGEIKTEYLAYFQFIRTPPLKGLRFNRFVTDSHINKVSGTVLSDDYEAQGGCDFLLHDGRACDAIEAAFLHDGPAVNAINMIEKLNNLPMTDLEHLRAFLYSL